MDAINHLFCVIVMCLIRDEKCSKSRSFIYLVKFILKFVLLFQKKIFLLSLFFYKSLHSGILPQPVYFGWCNSADSNTSPCLNKMKIFLHDTYNMVYSVHLKFFLRLRYIFAFPSVLVLM